MVNYDHYTYKITWSSEDQEFVGLCAEFPSCYEFQRFTHKIISSPSTHLGKSPQRYIFR